MKIDAKKYPSHDVFKFLREGLNLTQKELSKKVGINISSIEKYETNRQNYTYKTLLKIINMFDLDIIMKENVNSYKSNELVRYLRKNLNLTQVEFSKKIGISLSSLEKYESGRQDYPFIILIKIANIFNYDLIIKNK